MRKNNLQSGSNSPRLVRLNQDDLHLDDLGQLIHCPSGMALNEVGLVPSCCYYLKRGRIICCEMTERGEQSIYDYIDPGTLFLEEYLLFDRPCPILYKPMIDSDLIKISADTIKYAYGHNFQIVTEICENLADKMTTSVNRHRMETKHNASWKICQMLLFYAQNYGALTSAGQIRIDLSVSQQKLADLLGMNRVTVTKKLKELKEQGLIEVRSRHYYIPDVDQIIDYMLEIENEV